MFISMTNFLEEHGYSWEITRIKVKGGELLAQFTTFILEMYKHLKWLLLLSLDKSTTLYVINVISLWLLLFCKKWYKYHMLNISLWREGKDIFFYNYKYYITVTHISVFRIIWCMHFLSLFGLLNWSISKIKRNKWYEF